MTQKYTFNPFDMSAYTQSFNMENFTASSQRTMENTRAASEALMGSMSKLAQRQNEMMQNAIQESVQATKAFSSLRGIEDFMNYQTDYARRSFETAQKNASELNELARKCSTECTEICQKAATETANIWSEQQPKASAKTSTASSK